MPGKPGTKARLERSSHWYWKTEGKRILIGNETVLIRVRKRKTDTGQLMPTATTLFSKFHIISWLDQN